VLQIADPLPCEGWLRKLCVATIGDVIVAELLDTLAHDIPDLHGAAYRGHAALFDVADRHDR